MTQRFTVEETQDTYRDYLARLIVADKYSVVDTTLGKSARVFSRTPNGETLAHNYAQFLNSIEDRPNEFAQLVENFEARPVYGSMDFVPASTSYRAYIPGGIHIHWCHTDSWTQVDRRDRFGIVYVHGEKEESTEGLAHTLRGQDLEMDKAWNQLNRRVVKNKRDLIQEVVTNPLFENLPDEIRSALSSKLSFSRYAGCSCPCSPGFRTSDRRILGPAGALWIEKK